MGGGWKGKGIMLTSRYHANYMNNAVPQNDIIICQCQGAIPKDSLVAKLENFSKGAKLNIKKNYLGVILNPNICIMYKTWILD